MTRSIDTKIAFITGANRGIGFETARQLGRLGMTVLIGARQAAAGDGAARSLRDDGIDAHALTFDVTNPAHHEYARAWLASRAGRLDVLVNNAGVHFEGEPGVETLYVPSTLPAQVLRDTLEANFVAPVALTQVLLPLLHAAPAARIVNLSSILASLTLHAAPDSPIAGALSLAYDASKTALNAFTIHLAKELNGSRIKVNSAHPGWVQTAMGGRVAPMALADGALTSVQLATLPDDGPSGGFFHLGEPLPW